METIVILEKPAILAPDLRSCGNVGDLVSAIKDLRPESFNDMETFSYSLHGPDGSQMPLNGPYYDPQRPLPRPVDSVLRISARPTEMQYDLLIRLPHQEFASPWPVWGCVGAQWNDTGRRLQESIHAKYGIPLHDSMLSFCGSSIFDTMSLYEQKIVKGSAVSVKLSVPIKYQFKEEEHVICVWSDDTMITLLEKIAKRIDESLKLLRFAIIRCTGTVVNEAKEWLPDRSNIFSADCTAGTVEENGFRSGDSIKVYRQQESATARKRKLEETW
ncbi:hypothetical protein AYO20_07141 [Fonsecaea nubica]|uniref:Ubiquitin-like domain-containing protein n=1 Tax=Fonsecaea nubica TaxID=856822 RepID=A0A178CWK9_9EURO|nr:hypothetical protein AYO20_07141 [Fonsecaea nubica]OAL33634.1 hypothetical protein AYO20_07141 [Fonsecaea nubica]